MKVETRMFKHSTHLLFIAETKEEAEAIDLILDTSPVSNLPHKITGEICVDDAFNPYLRFKKP